GRGIVAQPQRAAVRRIWRIVAKRLGEGDLFVPREIDLRENQPAALFEQTPYIAGQIAAQQLCLAVEDARADLRLDALDEQLGFGDIRRGFARHRYSSSPRRARLNR